jgi:hypothetical protein
MQLLHNYIVATCLGFGKAANHEPFGFPGDNENEAQLFRGSQSGFANLRDSRRSDLVWGIWRLEISGSYCVRFDAVVSSRVRLHRMKSSSQDVWG